MAERGARMTAGTTRHATGANL
ncbi:MAG: hypothetical protein QOF10_4537, partial [Kribbellaceae bacterium]|nr:hypothetical protein [Kribbellaceae bacterium]